MHLFTMTLFLFFFMLYFFCIGRYSMKKRGYLDKGNLLKIGFYIFIFLFFLFNFAILNNSIGDNFFNYGFAYNIAKGMIPYRDFNMVLFPLSSFLCAFVMRIFGTKLIIYYIMNSVVATLILYVVNKLDKSVSIIILFLLLIFPVGGYNYLCLLLLFIIIYLEKNKANDFLIGLMVGGIVLTNQKMLLLILPALLFIDYRRVIKRIVGIIIPFQILVLYLFVNNALYDFLDYTIFGLFDFGHSNSNVSIYLVLELIMAGALIYKYLKYKDKKILYCVCFQLITVPTFDMYHTSLALIAFVFCNCHSSGKTLKIVNLVFISYMILIVSGKTLHFLNKDTYYLELNPKENYYLTLGSKGVDVINDKILDYYYQHIGRKDIYFLCSNMYYYKLRAGIPINKFDLVLMGNNGYNGNLKLENKIRKMKNTLFIVYDIEDENVMFDQNNYELIDFITSNYKKVDDLGYNFVVYEIDN